MAFLAKPTGKLDIRIPKEQASVFILPEYHVFEAEIRRRGDFCDHEI
jgi:hypothetical protein